MTQYRYWTAEAPGARENLVLETGPVPEPEAGELLVEVKAVGVNRLDINHRSAMDKDGILGVEMSGRVVENNSDDTRFKEGTHVAGIVSSGAYVEYVTIPAGQAMVIPEELSFAEAAAIPEVFLTAYQTLFWLGDLQEGETVLIHAGGSGVGTAAIQLAKKLAKAQVITTAGQEKKLDITYSLGADHAVNYKEEDFSEHVLKETEEHGADVILDFIGASYYEKNMKSIAVVYSVI
jgi:NADPH:quinone reductase-like Zn-dependent oxidoreductase